MTPVALAPPPPSVSERRLALGLALAVALVALLVRGPTVENGLVNYDDPQVVAEVRAKGPVELASGPAYYAYKPVYFLSLWVDHVLFDDAPWGFHLGNVAFFAAAVAVLVLLVHSVFRSKTLAVAAGLLLAVHPVHSESVAWIAERKDSLSLLLALLAHLAFRRARTRDPDASPWLAAVLLALAGLTKGTVWTYAGVLVLDDLLLAGHTSGLRKGRLARLAPVVAVAVLGIATDAVVGATMGPGDVRHDASLVELAAAMAAVHARYLASMFVPAGLSVDYPVDPRGSWADPLAWAGVLLAAIALAAVVWGVRRRNPVVALAAGLWVLGLAPVNNVFPQTAVLRADRYLLVPAIGLYLLVGALLRRLPVVPRAALLAGLAAGLGFLAHARGEVWADSQALWTDAIEKEPGSAVAFLNRSADDAERAQAIPPGSPGSEAERARAAWWERAEADARRGIEAAEDLRRPELVLRGRLARALPLLVTGRAEESLTEANAAETGALALARSPWVKEAPASILAQARSARGQALLERSRTAADADARTRDLEEAKKAFRLAAAADPSAVDAWMNLGNVLTASGKAEEIDEGIDALKRALALAPDHVDTVTRLVRALYRRQRDAEGRAVLEAARARAGDPLELALLSAGLMAEIGDAAAAEATWRGLYRRYPLDARVVVGLVRHLKNVGLAALAEARSSRDEAALEKAVSKFDAAAEVHRTDPDAALYAGDALVMLSRFFEARERYSRALALDPEKRWIRNLVARAAVLDAAAALETGRAEAAAAAMGIAVKAEPMRLDVGYVSLDAEVPRLLPAVLAAEGKDPVEAEVARGVLAAAALLVCGDETGAMEAASAALRRLPGSPEKGSRLEAIRSAALILRAIVRARRIDLGGARDDLATVERASPNDALVRYHRLSIDRVEATARHRIADAGADFAAKDAAEKALDAIAAGYASLADARPGWPGPGLAVVEMAIGRGEWFAALKRLSTLVEEFPDSPAVQRGFSDVYTAQSLSGGDRNALLGQARAALERAERIDPRDPRTALALSQWWRLAGNLEMAAKHALSAASAEPVPGPASKALSALLVERARKALADGKPETALSLAKTARPFDRTSAGPDLIEGEEAMARKNYDAALKAFRRGVDRDLASEAARTALAGCLRKRGAAYFLWLLRYPKPVEKDGVKPDPKAVETWEQSDLLARRQALRELEESLRYEPAGEGADEAREMIRALRREDPDARRKALQDADRLYQEGRDLERAARREEALTKFREATDLDPDHVPAWWWSAATAFTLGPERDDAALMALARVKDLQPDSPLPIDFLRGRIWARHVKDDPEAAGLSRRALERYLLSPAARAKGAEEDVTLAKKILESLPKER